VDSLTASGAPGPTAASLNAEERGIEGGDLIEVRLSAIRYAAQDTNLFEFRRPDGSPLPPYTPGAHVEMHLPNGLVRHYSMIVPASNAVPATYTFGIKRDPASRGGSRFIHDELRVGRTLKMSPPRNNFPLIEDARKSIFLAGGIGITPIWCMVQRLEQLGHAWTLYYACRSRTDMAFLDALEGLAGSALHFDDENGGRFLDVARILGEAPADVHLYCCGPTPMMSAFEAAATGWPREQVHVEYFTPRADATRKGGFMVELARSGQEFFVPEGNSILQVLLDEGVDVDYSCELGICGACEQRVIAGIPEHRDSILSEEEQAENTRVMICCAGCKTERLVLDL
jgi:ferredoxin-NADP reductase